MTDKLSDKDKKDWEKFLKNPGKIENKDVDESEKFNFNIEKSIDLHGYTLDDANKKIYSFIKDCFENKVNKIKIITGKGLRSKNTNDPYQSKDLSILKHSVPNYIKDSPHLMSKINKIDQQAVDSPLKGNFEIYLKKKL